MASGNPLQHLRIVVAMAAFVMAGWLVSLAPARADLRVCNETANPVSVALGYKADKGWQTEGWWVAPPTRCAIVFQGTLASRFYYLYVADDIGGGAWDGTFYMCTRDETFTIFDINDCLARGYERTGFFEVDTQNNPDWTLQLTETPGEGDGGDNGGEDLGTDAVGTDAPGDIVPPEEGTEGDGGDAVPLE